jgi:hypothetical protein
MIYKISLKVNKKIAQIGRITPGREYGRCRTPEPGSSLLNLIGYFGTSLFSKTQKKTAGATMSQEYRLSTLGKEENESSKNFSPGLSIISIAQMV